MAEILVSCISFLKDRSCLVLSLPVGRFFITTIHYFLIFIYFCLCWVFVAVHEVSLVMASRGYSSGEVCRLFVAVASLVTAHRL